jgi:hypothetical protein
MMEKTVPLTQRETYEPSRFTEFLWWLSTAEKELLADAVVDRNRHKIIGMTVLATWAFATMAWTYFFSTVATSLWLAIPLGFFMGFIILTIDRALIKGINGFSKNKLLPLLFRGLLAVTIGTFMAQPALLYMFAKEIRLQASLDNEKKKMLKSQELNDLYKNKKATLIAGKEVLQKELAIKYADVATARQNFLAETDGSGGTGKVGIKDIAIAKRNEYQKLDGEYQQLLKNDQPKIAAIETDLKMIDDTVKKEEADFTGYFNNGFLTQIEALNNLIKTNPALQFRYYLLVIILLLIELMPVIAKTMLPSGTYDERAMQRETMEKEMVAANISKEKELKELYNSLAHQNDKEAIAAFFDITKEDRTQKIKGFGNRWKEENGHTFNGLWEKMKTEILTRQEH